MSWLPYIPGFLVRLVVSLNRDKPRDIAFYVIKKLFSVILCSNESISVFVFKLQAYGTSYGYHLGKVNPFPHLTLSLPRSHLKINAILLMILWRIWYWINL